MHTVPPPAVSDAARPPRITEWAAELEWWAAQRGLPPEPWPLPYAAAGARAAFPFASAPGGSPVAEPDPPVPAEIAVAMLRDITEAVASLAERMFGLPEESTRT